MATRSYVIALLSVSLSLGTAAAITGLAVEKDRRDRVETLTADACPPGSCTVVTKTTVGGPPSRIHNIEAVAVGPAHESIGGVAIASLAE